MRLPKFWTDEKRQKIECDAETQTQPAVDDVVVFAPAIHNLVAVRVRQNVRWTHGRLEGN